VTLKLNARSENDGTLKNAALRKLLCGEPACNERTVLHAGFAFSSPATYYY